MRTQTLAHRTERVSLPRRLVPRRRMIQAQSHFVSEFYSALDNSPSRYAVGDMIEFADNQGRSHFLTILGLNAGGSIDGMIYDGQPHHVCIKMQDLAFLRVRRLDRMRLEDVAIYRNELGLNTQEVAA